MLHSLLCRDLFNVFSPSLIQDLAIVARVLFNVFWFWGPKSTGPNPDHPFETNLRGLPGPSVPWDPYSGRLISIFLGALLLGGGPEIQVSPTLIASSFMKSS